ncbi:MAG: RidA family protein [Chloroflexota bacterium]
MAPAITPTDIPRPSGFSYAFSATGDRSVYFAGHTAVDREGHIVGPGDVVAQFEQALRNLKSTAEAAGVGLGDLVKLTLFVTDVEAYKTKSQEIGVIYRRFFGSHYPAMSLVGVQRLWDDQAMIEIEGVAVH